MRTTISTLSFLSNNILETALAAAAAASQATTAAAATTPAMSQDWMTMMG